MDRGRGWIERSIDAHDGRQRFHLELD